TNVTVSGSNTALVCCIIIDAHDTTDTQPTLSTVVWDPTGANQSLSLIIRQDAGTGSGSAVIWYGLVNPTPGNKTLRVTFSNQTGIGFWIQGSAFTGADQTGGATTFHGSTGSELTTGAGEVTVSS